MMSPDAVDWRSIAAYLICLSIGHANLPGQYPGRKRGWKMKIASGVVIGIVALVVASPIIFHFEKLYTERNIPSEIVGTWSGKGRAAWEGVEYDLNDERRWLSVQITIHEDGTVSGTADGIDGAKGLMLHKAVAKKNRGVIGRKLNMWTDHVIRGRATGFVDMVDKQQDRYMSLPFNISNDGILTGTIFTGEKKSWGLEPTYVYLQLRK